MQSNTTLRRMTWLLSGLAMLFVLVWQAPAFHTVQGLANYLPLHMFAETFSIVIALMVFGVAWNAFSMERSGNMIILACALLAVGLIDFAHMLSFKGMPDFITPSGPEKAINLWLAGRLVAALGLLAVALRPWQPFRNPRARYGLLAGSLIVAALVVWAGIVYPQAWPHTFIAGQGLTPFKIGAEYAIIAILLVPAILFYLQSRRTRSYDAFSLFAATVITILSELSFTLYSDVADVFNLLGHLYKIVAYAFIYRAVFVAGVRDPFQRLDVELAENRRISEELRTSSLYTRSLIETNLDPLVTISADGKITDVNQATERATGCSRLELIGTDFSGYFTEPDKAREGYRQVFATGSITDYSLTLRHRDGHVTDVLYNASVYRNEAGDVLGVLAAARDITEHKRAEETRTRLAAIVESSSDAIIGKTVGGIITSWNKGAERIYGYSADEIIGKPITALVPPSLHAEIRDLLEKVRKGGIVTNHESERIRKDGARINVALTLSPIRDASGNISGISTIARDITERRQAEQALFEAQQIFRILVENSPDIITRYDRDCRRTYVNPTYLKVAQMPRRELLGSAPAQLSPLPPSSAEVLQLLLRRVLAGGAAEAVDVVWPMADNIDHWYNIYAFPEFDREGRIVSVMTVSRDITERKLNEEALQRLNRELRAISNCNQTLMRAEDEQSLLDAICRIVCDEAGYRMAWVGYPQNDEARTIRPVAWAGVEDGYLAQAGIAWADTERGRGPCGIAIRSGKSAAIQDFGTDPVAVPWRDAALQRGYRSSLALPLKDESEKTFGILTIYATTPNAFTPEEIRLLEELAGDLAFGIVALRTRSEGKRMEEQIRQLNQELERRVIERTAQLEAANNELEAFSYSVSHDLRAPLRAINGFSNILLDDYRDKLDDEGKRLLNVVQDNTNRMGQLIDDILKFSRTGRLEMTLSEIDMEGMAHEVVAELQSSAAGTKPQFEIGPLPPARGDSAMMRQVFVNLLSNAIKFSRTREMPRIQVGATVEAEATTYFVKDNGVGFDMQYAGQLFGVFQRLHGVTEFEGTGIGLAIVKRIVSRHGGRVWAEGKVNEGATLYFSLPHSAPGGAA